MTGETTEAATTGATTGPPTAERSEREEESRWRR